MSLLFRTSRRDAPRTGPPPEGSARRAPSRSPVRKRRRHTGQAGQSSCGARSRPLPTRARPPPPPRCGPAASACCCCRPRRRCWSPARPARRAPSRRLPAGGSWLVAAAQAVPRIRRRPNRFPISHQAHERADAAGRAGAVGAAAPTASCQGWRWMRSGTGCRAPERGGLCSRALRCAVCWAPGLPPTTGTAAAAASAPPGPLRAVLRASPRLGVCHVQGGAAAAHRTAAPAGRAVHMPARALPGARAAAGGAALRAVPRAAGPLGPTPVPPCLSRCLPWPPLGRFCTAELHHGHRLPPA
jgi:hypothetical protein